jgi:hypothetical protein
MKQIRLQPLNEAYQQLSTLLCKTVLSIHTTDYTAPEEWMRLIKTVRHTYAAFKMQAEKEERILFPILHNYEPALVAILYDNRCSRIRYMHDLCELFTAMQAADDNQKSKLYSHKLLYRLDEFIAATVQQMKEQELMVNAVLWKYYSDKELEKIAATLSVKSEIQSYKKDTTFADTVINHIIPSTAMQPAYKRRVADQAFKQHGATELALAI